MEKDKYRKIRIECELCKTKFEIWISEMNYSSEMELRIRKNFYKYCPVCKILKEIRKKSK
ncbi:MAG: hypothetical protein CO034_03015 [Parcubacteria group bacterium CG_4_9_14_0_2_um_filter_35_11]|nr:MAG: hypothetical protein COS98_01535 [Parcubacteria group bacterium CG07_land_8_20_14_0_80_35_11]PJC47290.1 MAG: hypothetical protein CO034_03015 [Parcubacteria group bacterium CG_4_9_14_0_2_um_filter_35_11]